MNELRVDIGGSSRGFQIATEQTKNMARDLQRSLEGYAPDTFKGAQAMRDQYGKVFDEVKGTGGFGGLAGSIGVATVALYGMYEVGKNLWQVLKDSFQLWRDARTFGMTTTGLQRLDIAGQEQGFDVGEGRGRLNRFTDKVGAAAEGNKEAMNIFKDSGIEIDGKTMEQILGEVADAFDRIQDPAQRAHLAVQLFGRGGQEMIPILQQMKEGGGEWANAIVSSEQTDAVLGGFWKKLHAGFVDLKNMAKTAGKDVMADFIEGYTGYVGEVNTPAKVAAQGETPEEKAAKAAKHAKDLEDAKAALHREQEATADPGARYTMLKLDRDDLEVALQRAEAAGDEVEQLKIKTELLGKNKAISEAEKAIHDVAKKAEPKKPAATKYTSEHVDSLSSAGLFTSEGAVSNPLLDVGRQQLDVLKGLRSDIQNRPDIFAP